MQNNKLSVVSGLNEYVVLRGKQIVGRFLTFVNAYDEMKRLQTED